MVDAHLTGLSVKQIRIILLSAYGVLILTHDKSLRNTTLSFMKLGLSLFNRDIKENLSLDRRLHSNQKEQSLINFS